MSAGNPVEARHAIRGLETGDPIAWTVIPSTAHDPAGWASLANEIVRKAPSAAAVLIVAIPAQRRDAVIAAMEGSTV